MLFSVIYSADCPSTESIARFRPPHARRHWDRTEGDEQYSYTYLEGDWERGKHRKWAAMLTKDEFREFIKATGLVAEDVETMGSLGAPGFASAGRPQSRSRMTASKGRSCRHTSLRSLKFAERNAVSGIGSASGERC